MKDLSVMSFTIRKIFFFIITFLLGSIGLLYTDFFNASVILATVIGFFCDRKQFVENIKQDNLYIKIPCFFLLYLLCHTGVLLIRGSGEIKYNYTIFESLLLYFILIPFYVCSVRDLFTPSVIKRCLLLFAVGVALFNTAAFYKLSTPLLFHDPLLAIKNIAASRFGANKDLFGGFVFLEPQSLYINIAALISFYFSIIASGFRRKLGYLCLGVLFVFFLMLAETKSAFVSFAFGFLILTIFALKGKTVRYKLRFSILVACGCFLLVVLAPDSLKKRFEIAQKEVHNVLDKKLAGGGTIMPRVALYKVNLSHWDEFAFLGLGVAQRATVKQWYAQSDYGISGLTDPHNSFMNYWLIGGIPGLLFILSFFILPVWRMFRKKSFVYLIGSLWMTVLVANNTCVLLMLNDSKPLIIFWFALFYWGSRSFYELESHPVPEV